MHLATVARQPTSTNRYGMALRRMDLNHFYYETEIDNLGRVKAVRGPNELATGVPYIIAFDYQPKATFGTNGINIACLRSDQALRHTAPKR